DYIVQNDRLVTQALRFIRRNYFRPIAVIDVVKHVDVSRRTLENRFLAATGRTIMDDIIHQRFERAKQLLISTDEPVAVISILSGFVNYRSMLHAFNMSEHCTPNEFRQKWR
ncbi:MAG: AraC family transcriptional regulator, partial [Thermoguttaceae bacterium]|nr:AraC family transcriptional regulator [Thermoguttaceae bacterium]